MDEKMTRETLIIRLKKQYDEHAWNEFSSIYSGFIHAILFKMNVNSGDKDDLAQEILLKSWKNIPKFDYNRERGKFRNWLGRIVSNTVKNYYRSTASRRKAHSGSQETYEHFSEPDIEKIAQEEWRTFISNMAWENVKETLPDISRECFELLSQGMSPTEVSEKLDIKYNNVCVYKKRVINKISHEILRLEEDLS